MSFHCRHWVALAAMLLSQAAVASAPCTAASGPQRVALLELYTSQGCDSCPPTDSWLSALPARGFTTTRILALAFHVDYWDHLGWKDPYAQPRFSERQRLASARNQARFVYTPQLLLNGRDYRRGLLRDDLAEKVAAISRDRPRAAILLRQAPIANGMLAVSAKFTLDSSTEGGQAQAYLALYENDLATPVAAGENRGKKLRHDFVVRELAGPFNAGSGDSFDIVHNFRLARGWKPGDLHVAAFVQNRLSGDVLQALAAPRCN
jgi:hypothetical protein